MAWLAGLPAVAQNTNIGGTINDYQQVTAISGGDITVASSAAFSVGDRVLLIQMQGATIYITGRSGSLDSICRFFL